MPTNTQVLFLVVLFFAVCLSDNGVLAFGAGNIPSFAYMEGRAFRHGDIEDTLAELAKKGATGFAISSLLGKGGSKFGGLDIKRVYFGNWLRDYSQAVDIASLKKVQLPTILNLCMALGFLAHGYATGEFEVTAERLGCYLPTEHIDNPKGYGEGEDARRYHPGLRGPVDPRELEVDPRTGMKNYIANEGGHWDTSKALVRRTFEQCIKLGRQHRQSNQKADLYEAYRLLGQGLHTLEDFSAHSNFCELSLVNMGHSSVFLQVGDHVRIQAPNGRSVAPLVTGSFGSSDFVHSLLGEATDHISEASVSDLNRELDNARSRERGGPGSSGGNPTDVLRDLLFKLPGGGGGEMTRELDGVERIRAGPSQGGKRPEDMSPQELHAVLWQVLSFRDSVVKKISATIEKIPGLGPLVEKLMDSISVFVFTTLEPFLKPIMKTATAGLSSASGEVINSHDQYEVFDDPRASDPTHSFLSKDHFNLILNEPAGHLAKIILAHAVGLITKAWDDSNMNVHQVTEEILECLFHPDFHSQSSKVQREMMHYMQTWVQSLGNQQMIISRLSKQAVRNHENIRKAGEGGPPEAQGSYAYNQGVQAQHNIGSYVQGIPIVGQAAQMMGSFSGQGGQGGRREIPSNPGGGGAPLMPNAPTYTASPPPAPPKVPGDGAPLHAGHAHAHHQPHHQPHHSQSQSQGPPMGGYSAPSGPPAPNFPGAHSGGYSSPMGAPPAFPGAPSSYEHGYSLPPPGPPPQFPGYTQPPAGPGFPGPTPFGAPPGPPPQFPGGPPAPGGYPPYNNNRGSGW
jgi:hypothetical protein